MNATQAAPTPAGRKRFRVAIAGAIDAPAGDVYRMIADYQHGHQHIVPPQYIRNLRVLEGGYGDGTVIEFDMIAFGATQHARARITEPEPGRTIVETDLDRGFVTTFMVVPLGDSSRVTIATDLTVRFGILGAIQRRIFSRYLGRVFRAEFERLTQVMREERSAST